MAFMREQVAGHIEVVNRLKGKTLEGKLVWERTGEYGKQYTVRLNNGYRATVQKAPAGNVVVTLVNESGVATVHLDSSRAADDLLKVAILQLYVAVRDTVASLLTRDALEAVEDI